MGEQGEYQLWQQRREQRRGAKGRRITTRWNMRGGIFSFMRGQRITIFNYFIVFAGIILTGLASVIQASPRLSVVGIAMGFLLSLLSFIFWKLDQRTSFFVKHAEERIKTIEPAEATLFQDEVAKTENTKGIWTYGRAFRAIFFVMGFVGILGSVVSGLRLFGILSWADEAKPSVVAPASPTPTPTPGTTH